MTVEIETKVNMEALDAAIAKAERLVELLTEANKRMSQLQGGEG